MIAAISSHILGEDATNATEVQRSHRSSSACGDCETRSRSGMGGGSVDIVMEIILSMML